MVIAQKRAYAKHAIRWFLMPRSVPMAVIAESNFLSLGGSRASIYDTSETTKYLGWKPVHDWPVILEEVLATVQRMD